MITTTTFIARVEAELAARGITVTIPTARVFYEAISDCLFTDLTGLWKITPTIPGAGPTGPPSPHTHTPLPGVITTPAISAFLTARCVGEGWAPGSGWEILRDAISTGISVHLLTALTNAQDGNTPHIHAWVGLNASILKGLIMAPLWSNPNLDLTEPASKLEDYVEAVSGALVDEIEQNGQAIGYVPVGLTHTHLLT